MSSREHSGSVVDCLNQDRGAPGSVPHPSHCIVSLSKTHLSLLSTGSTKEDQSQQSCKIVDWEVKNQTEHSEICVIFQSNFIKLFTAALNIHFCLKMFVIVK